MPAKIRCVLPSLVVEAYGKSRKMECDYYGQRRTRWFLWKEVFKPSDIHRRLSAVCQEREREIAPAGSTVFKWGCGSDCA